MSNDENNSASSMMVSPSDARKIINHALDVVQEREQEGDDPSVTLGELVTTMRRNLDDGAITEGIKRYEAELPDLSRGVQQLAAHLQSKLMFYYQHGNVPGYAVETSIEVPGSREQNRFVWRSNNPDEAEHIKPNNERLQQAALYGAPNFVRYQFYVNPSRVLSIQAFHERVTYDQQGVGSSTTFTFKRRDQELFEILVSERSHFLRRSKTTVRSARGSLPSFVTRYLSAKGYDDFNNKVYAFAVEQMIPVLREKVIGTGSHMKDFLSAMED
jgi:hypothetical protein